MFAIAALFLIPFALGLSAAFYPHESVDAQSRTIKASIRAKNKKCPKAVQPMRIGQLEKDLNKLESLLLDSPVESGFDWDKFFELNPDIDSTFIRWLVREGVIERAECLSFGQETLDFNTGKNYPIGAWKLFFHKSIKEADCKRVVGQLAVQLKNK